MSPIEEQAREVLSLLRNHLAAYGERLDRDQKRSIAMAIQRLERGLAGERGTDPGRTLGDWMGSSAAAPRRVQSVFESLPGVPDSAVEPGDFV